MKCLVFYFLMVVSLIGCGSAPIDKQSTQAKQNQRPWAPIVADQLTGSWQGVFHCSGLDYIVDVNLNLNDNRLSAVMQGQAIEPRRLVSGGTPFREQSFNASYIGSINRQTGAFNLQPSTRGQFPSFNGVYVPEQKQLAAQITGRQWRNCSQMLIASPASIEQLTQRFAVKNKRSRLSVFSHRGVFKPKKICSKQNVTWLNQYFDSLPAQSSYRLNPRPYIEHMYRDASFEQAFGKSLYEYQDTPSQILHGQLTKAGSCEGLSQKARQYAQFLQPLVTPLLNHVSLSRNMVIINIEAKTTFLQWFNRNEVMLRSLKPHSAADAKQMYTRIQPLIKTATQYSPFVLPERVNDSFFTSHEKAQQQLSAIIFNQYLDNSLALKSPNVNDLKQLAALPSQRAPFFNVMAKADKNIALQRINTQLKQKSKASLLHFIENQPQNLQAYQSVGAWRSRYAALLEQMQQQDVLSIENVVKQKQQTITTVLAQRSAKDYQSSVFNQGSSLAVLAASVQFEKNIEMTLAPLLNKPQIAENRRQQTRHRQQLFRVNLSSLIQLALQQEHVTGLQHLQNTYFWSKDPLSVESKQVFYAIKQRQQALAPFDENGGRYLNALYGGDFKKLADMDKVFVEPYQRLFSGETLGAMGTLFDGLAGIAGFKTNFMAGMQAELSSSSLIVPVFAVYLIDYQYKYKHCLEPNAIRFQKTTTSETVYRDGWGNYQYSVPHPNQVEFFTVNQRFAHVFKEVGLNNADSPLAQFTDSFLGKGNDQRINVRALLRNTRKMMDEHTCNSPLIQKMEAQMLHFFDSYLERKRKAKAAFFR